MGLKGRGDWQTEPDGVRMEVGVLVTYGAEGVRSGGACEWLLDDPGVELLK